MKNVGYPLLLVIAEFWTSRVHYEEKTKDYHIYGVIGPDENARGPDHKGVNDNVYTNALVADCLGFAYNTTLRLNGSAPAQWATIAGHMFVPFDAGLRLHPEYDGYLSNPQLTVKQADVVLLGYPLPYKMPTDVRRNDLEFYEKHTDIYGSPGLTWGIFVTGWLEMGEVERADKLLNQSYQASQNLPFLVWQESPKGGCPHFITGAGGFLQGICAGFAGIRLLEGRIQFDPRLPQHATYVKLRKFHYLSNVIDIYYNTSRVSFTLARTKNIPLEVAYKGSSYPLVLGKSLSFSVGEKFYVQRRPKEESL